MERTAEAEGAARRQQGAVCQHDRDHGPGGHCPAGTVRHHPHPLDPLLPRCVAGGGRPYRRDPGRDALCPAEDGNGH